jgi:pilus assembly protein Flp/PilA
MKKFIRFFKDEGGATAVEYCIMVGLIAIVIFAAVTLLGTNVSQKFSQAASGVQ